MASQQDLSCKAGETVGQAQVKKDEVMSQATSTQDAQSAAQTATDLKDQAASFLQQAITCHFHYFHWQEWLCFFFNLSCVCVDWRASEEHGTRSSWGSEEHTWDEDWHWYHHLTQRQSFPYNLISWIKFILYK